MSPSQLPRLSTTHTTHTSSQPQISLATKLANFLAPRATQFWFFFFLNATVLGPKGRVSHATSKQARLHARHSCGTGVAQHRRALG